MEREKIVLLSAVLFFFFLVYAAIATEQASFGVLAMCAREGTPRGNALRFYHTGPPARTVAVQGLLDGKPVAATRVDYDKTPGATRLMNAVQRRFGQMTVVSGGAVATLVDKSRFEELRGGGGGAASRDAVFFYRVQPTERYAFPWPAGAGGGSGPGAGAGAVTVGIARPV